MVTLTWHVSRQGTQTPPEAHLNFLKQIIQSRAIIIIFIFLREQSCNYLAEILPPTPTAE